MICFRRHDRYVLKSYWTAFGAVLLFFTVIVIVIHLADRSGRMIRHYPLIREAGYDPVMATIEYYATLVPFLWIQLVPLAAVLAAAFSLSRLTRNNELAPLVTSGVSTRRITLPVLVSGVVLVGAVFIVQEDFAPTLSRRHLHLSRLLNESEPDRITRVPHFDDPGGGRLSMAAYEPTARRIDAGLLSFRTPDGVPSSLRFYPLLEWDPNGRRWIAVEGGTLFPLGEDRTGTVRRPLPPGEAAPLDADVQLLEVSVLKDLALGLSTKETAALVRANPDSTRLVYLHNEQFTRCLYPVVLLLLGLPFCLGLGRRSSLPGTVAVLGTGAALYSASFLSAHLATSGEVNAVVMAWLPDVLLGSIGLSLWLTMRS